MILRRPSEADRHALASCAARLQVRPEHHVAYLGTDADVIAAEMLEDVDDWTEAAAVAVIESGSEPGRRRIVGWLMGSIDHDMGRVWWFGPFVDTSLLATSLDAGGPGAGGPGAGGPGAGGLDLDESSRWCDVADRLDAVARAGLPSGLAEEEYAFDARNVVAGAWATARGFVADPGSAVLVLDHPLDPPSLPIRPVQPTDVDTVARLHDELFPNTHTRGAVLVTSAGPDRIRLVVERDGDVAGYVAVERQPDGNGYVDFLGVAPGHRRRGLGAELVRAGVAALAELGCRRFDLTVREADTGARALYAGLGFNEERLVRPFRRGFSLR